MTQSASAWPLKWQHQLHHRANDRTLIGRSLILAPERHSKLCRVAPEDGTVVWCADVVNPWGWLAAGSTICAYLNQHSYLQCFDLVNGSERWATDLSGRHGQTFGHLLIVGETLITGGWRGYTDVVALSALDGSVLWTIPGRHRPVSLPVPGADGTMVLAAPDEGRATVVDVESGAAISELPCPARNPPPDGGSFLLASEGTFVCVGDQGRVCELNPASADGWSTVLQHKRGIRSDVPLVSSDRIFFEDEEGNLCAYARTDGHQLWEEHVHHRRRDILPATIRSDGTLAFGSADGQLYVFDRDGLVLGKQTIGKRFGARLAEGPAQSVLAAVDGRILAIEPALP